MSSSEGGPLVKVERTGQEAFESYEFVSQYLLLLLLLVFPLFFFFFVVAPSALRVGERERERE